MPRSRVDVACGGKFSRPRSYTASSLVVALWAISLGGPSFAGGGDFNLGIRDESTGRPTIARVEITRQTSGETPSIRRRINRPLKMPKTVAAGRGFLIDGDVDLALPDGTYQFRITRGPEYRSLTGHFSIERTSQDSRRLSLPRILDLRQQGWTSGDCLLDQSQADRAVDSLPMRMAAADLHLLSVCPPAEDVRSSAGRAIEKPVPGRELHERFGVIGSAVGPVQGDGAEVEAPEAPEAPEDWSHLPVWIDPHVRAGGGLAFYGPGLEIFEGWSEERRWFEEGRGQPSHRDDPRDAGSRRDTPDSDREADWSSETWLATRRLVAASRHDPDAAEEESIRVAVTDPFAWPLPVWLASGRIDGFFVLGDWLRLDRRVLSRSEARPVDGAAGRSPTTLGREAEQIYWHLLDCGLSIVPLAGTIGPADTTPLGYNRLYVAGMEEGSRLNGDGTESAVAVSSAPQWWQNAWAGRSVATNGPLLCPTLQGRLPGHTFELSPGESFTLTPELQLTVQDPVDYLEVIVNGSVHESVRLDEFAAAGGRLSPIIVDRPGWAVIRVVTQHPEHFRAATSAPWFFTVDGKRRVSARSVAFFQRWLGEYEARLKELPPEKLRRHVGLVRAARSFWGRLEDVASTTARLDGRNRGN